MGVVGCPGGGGGGGAGLAFDVPAAPDGEAVEGAVEGAGGVAAAVGDDGEGVAGLGPVVAGPAGGLTFS